MTKKKEWKSQSTSELWASLRQVDQELFHLKNELTTHKKPHLLKEKRKDKARILTALAQKNKEKEAV